MDSPETNIFIVLTFLLIILNAFFIFAEIAVANSHKNQIEKLIDDGYKKATKALKIIDDPNPYFITVQVGNVCSNILIGLFTGIAIAPFLTNRLINITGSQIAAYVQPATLILSTFFIILICLVLSTTLPP